MLLCLYLPSSNRMLVRLVFLLSFLQLGCCIYSVFCLSFCLFWRINVFISGTTRTSVVTNDSV